MARYGENGYSVQTEGNQLEIVSPSGKHININNIEGLDALNLNSDSATFHGYVRSHWVGNDAQGLWDNLREHPAPHDLNAVGQVASTGSQTTIPRIGTVTHYVDDDNQFIANVTDPRHRLHPGTVFRFIDQRDDGYHIVTVGIGNGLGGSRNVSRSDQLWGQNAYLVGAEAALERNHPNISDADLVAWRHKTNDQLSELTNWRENNKLDLTNGFNQSSGVSPSPPSIHPTYESIDSAIMWSHQRLEELGVSPEKLNAIFPVEGTMDQRQQVEILHNLAEEQGYPNVQRYLQEIDYNLAIQGIVNGHENVVGIIGVRPESLLPTQEIQNEPMDLGADHEIIASYATMDIGEGPIILLTDQGAEQSKLGNLIHSHPIDASTFDLVETKILEGNFEPTMNDVNALRSFIDSAQETQTDISPDRLNALERVANIYENEIQIVSMEAQLEERLNENMLLLEEYEGLTSNPYEKIPAIKPVSITPFDQDRITSLDPEALGEIEIKQQGYMTTTADRINRLAIENDGIEAQNVALSARNDRIGAFRGVGDVGASFSPH